MVDYTAYLDASGTDVGQRVACFAGAISTTRRWRYFSTRLAKILDSVGLADLHWADFLYLDRNPGKTRALPQTERNFVFHHFGEEVVSISPLLVFGCSVDLAAYDRVFSQAQKAAIGSPQMICLPWCFFQALRRGIPASLPKEERISFVFDQDDRRRQAQAARMLRRFSERRSVAARVGDVGFGGYVMASIRSDDQAFLHLDEAQLEAIRDQRHTNDTEPWRGVLP